MVVLFALQVYKRKTEAAKKEYLKALAVYRASQLSQVTCSEPVILLRWLFEPIQFYAVEIVHLVQSLKFTWVVIDLLKPTIEVLDTAPSPPAAPVVTPAPEAPPPQPTPTRSSRIPLHAPDNNTITNICTSNIIIDLPQVTTRSRTGAHKPPVSSAPLVAPTPTLPMVTKIIIPKQPSARQPPPLQQMQNTPPPPRLQQMVHSVAPPPLQAKPRGGGAFGLAAVPVAATPPPPLQIKIVPAPAQADVATPIIVTSTTEAPTDAGAMEVDVAQPATIVTTEAEEGV